MSNPVLSDNIFRRESSVAYSAETMTIRGTINKTLVMLVLVFAAAAYTWKVFMQGTNPASVMPWMWGGLIGAFILAMVISFNPKTAPYLAPLYSVGEGLTLGAISAVYESAFAKTAPGIVANAVFITFITAFVMLFIYRKGIIKVDGKFMRILSIAMISIVVFYLGSFILSLFGVSTVAINNSSPLSIGISIVITVVAALNLLADYALIEKQTAMGAPKYMEWFGAFGLIVTLVWLYLEILRLLGKFANRN